MCFVNNASLPCQCVKSSRSPLRVDHCARVRSLLFLLRVESFEEYVPAFFIRNEEVQMFLIVGFPCACSMTKRSISSNIKDRSNLSSQKSL